MSAASWKSRVLAKKPHQPSRAYPRWQVLRRMLSYLKPYARWVVFCYVVWGLITGLEVVIPLMVGRAVDLGISAGDAAYLAWAVAVIVGLYLVKAASNYGYFALYHYYEAATARDVRNDMYQRLQRLSFAYFDRVDTGQLISRGTSDISALQLFLGHGTTTSVNAIGTYVVVLAVAASMSPPLTLVSVLPLPLLLVLAMRFGRELRPLFAAVQQQHGVMTGVLQENLAGIRVVKAFAREDYECQKFGREAQGLYDANMRMVEVMSSRMPTLVLLAGLSTILVLWLGGKLVIDGSITVGTLIAFSYFVARLVSSTRRVGWIINQVSRAFAAAQRIFEVMDTVPEVSDRPGARPFDNPRGEVRFEGVWFEYEPGCPVLKDVNLTVQPGQTVAIVGATGSGKSALVGLIPRYYDATKGRVLLDGVDVRDLALGSLRRQVGVVPQDPFLFSRSLHENIAFGRPQAEANLVHEAAEKAQVHRFASQLPDGYQTVVGDRGVGLSGGQRQRATMARAIIVEPRILILDDATSSVDVATEELIQQSLRGLMGDKTTFIIAHRLSTVQHADLVLVLEDGRVVEQGSHEELVRRGGAYARMYESQLKE